MPLRQDRHALLFGDFRAGVNGRTGDADDGGAGAGVPAEDGWALRHRSRDTRRFRPKTVSTRTIVQVSLLAVLAAFYAATAYVALHPLVSQHYRDYYIDQTTKDWRIDRRAGGLADGMAFGDSAYPLDVDYIKGLSRGDASGRWSDANLSPTVSILLARPVSGALCLDLAMRATPQQAGAPVAIRIGAASATVVPPDAEPHDWHVTLRPDQPATSIDLEPSRPTVVVDRRRTAIKLTRLQLRPGDCPT